MTTTISDVTGIIETTVLPRLEGVKRQGGYWIARCPAHPDKVASLGVKPHRDGTHAVLTCFAGCDRADVMAALGLEWRDVYPGRRPYKDPDPAGEYLYTGEHGEILYKKTKIRMPNGGKKPFYSVPDGRGGWRTGAGCMEGVRRVLYRLPQLVNPWAEDPIWYVEGEKDALALATLGEVATTGGGTSDFRPEFIPYFKGRDVLIVADKDEPGMKHACQVFAALKPVASFCWIVTAKAGKDASDHIRAGYGINDIEWLDCAPEIELPVTR